MYMCIYIYMYIYIYIYNIHNCIVIFAERLIYTSNMTLYSVLSFGMCTVYKYRTARF